jgi:hypothetical protein
MVDNEFEWQPKMFDHDGRELKKKLVVILAIGSNCD